MTQELHTYVYIPRIEYRNSNKYLYTNVHSRIIHNRQKVATVHVSVNSNQNMDKQNVEYTYSRILFNHKKKWSMDACYNVDEPQKHYAKWKKPDTKATYFNNST